VNIIRENIYTKPINAGKKIIVLYIALAHGQYKLISTIEITKTSIDKILLYLFTKTDKPKANINGSIDNKISLKYTRYLMIKVEIS